MPTHSGTTMPKLSGAQQAHDLLHHLAVALGQALVEYL